VLGISKPILARWRESVKLAVAGSRPDLQTLTADRASDGRELMR
jgi:hypothetical protein